MAWPLPSVSFDIVNYTSYIYAEKTIDLGVSKGGGGYVFPISIQSCGHIVCEGLAQYPYPMPLAQQFTVTIYALADDSPQNPGNSSDFSNNNGRIIVSKWQFEQIVDMLYSDTQLTCYLDLNNPSQNIIFTRKEPLNERWVQVNKDGFGYPPAKQSDDVGKLKLFVFGSALYATHEHGSYRMKRMNKRIGWKKVFVPANYCLPIGEFLYTIDDKMQLWQIKQGEEFSNYNWKKIISHGPSNNSIIPKALFKDQLYALEIKNAPANFGIWRSEDVGKTDMVWEKVLDDSFGDPQNHALGRIIEFKNKLVAVTTLTRTGIFGNPNSYGDGIEAWESASGDPGSWKQVNQDGFGTETIRGGKTFRTNQDFGCCSIYKGDLYIGTISYFGPEVWRYNGNGLNGWANITPPFEGVTSGMVPTVLRNNDMVVFNNDLYLAAGYPNGVVARYDGVSWHLILSADGTDPTTGGFISLVTLNKKLYVTTIHMPYISNPKWDQVWGYPYRQKFRVTQS